MFDKILDKLQKSGWKEICPTPDKWRFVKRKYMVELNWNNGTITFSKTGGV